VFGTLELGGEDKFDEKTAYAPRSPYAASKAASDHLVRAYHTTYGLPVTISNTSNNYGPYQFPEKLIPLAITNALANETIPIYGKGDQVRDWLYVEDHCRAIDKILYQGRAGETYLIGGLTDDIPNLEVVKKILKILDKPESLIGFVEDRPGHDVRYAIDWSKAKKELGYEPNYDFGDYLEKTVKWYEENEDWWRRVKSGDYQDYYQQQYGQK
jgi:dTDP-glucose 4,6-dehydratase